MASNVFVNVRAFNRKADNQYGKAGDKIISININPNSFFEEQLDQVIRDLQELKHNIEMDREKVWDDANERYQNYLKSK